MFKFFKKKPNYEKIGNDVYLIKGEIYFKDINYSYYGGGNIHYDSLDKELKGILGQGSSLDVYDPYQNLARGLLRWELSEPYEKIIIKRFKELRIERNERAKAREKEIKDKLKRVKEVK